MPRRAVALLTQVVDRATGSSTMRNSSMLLLLLALNLVSSCTHKLKLASNNDTLCNINFTKRIELSDLNVLVYADTHGTYVKMESCSPEYTLAIDFSESGLYTSKYEALLNAMRRNANLGRAPIPMVISGSYSGSTGPESRATIRVYRIVSYSI